MPLPPPAPDDSRLQFGAPPEDRPPLSPQLAVRVAIVGTVALALFAIIFFRLWFLQVLSGDQYIAQASANRTRQIAIAAPRGEILDRSGAVLVDSTKALAVQISPQDLPVPITAAKLATPPRPDAVVYNRLAHVLGIPTKRAACKLPGSVQVVRHRQTVTITKIRVSQVACDVAQQVSLLSYANATIKSGPDISKYVQFYLAERADLFPGVQVQQIYVTHYPQGTLAAQVLGTVGPISKPQYNHHDYPGASKSSIVGQMGVEAEYDSFLRGKDGAQKVQINSMGEPAGNLPGKAPTPGYNLKLSLDATLQRVGEESLKTSIDANYGSTGGAFVAMDPQNGQVYAMGSYPTFDPSVFTHPMTQGQYNALTNPNDGAPLLNRATQSFGPTGSTFKPITATAALESGAWSVGETYTDTGQFCFKKSTLCLHNAGHAVYGTLDLANALRVSSDVFFYNLGALTNPANPNAHHGAGGPIDQWAHRYGIGRSTGVDLPETGTGTLPSPRWRAGIDQAELACEKKRHPHITAVQYFTPAVSCGYADGRPWSIGDNVNLAVGQGDVQVSPLQLAIVYAALANGGTIVRPHFGLDVQNHQGTVLQSFNPPPLRHLNINPTYLDTIRAGLRAAASQPGGTSYDVMGNFPEQVYGKTGTAQYVGQNDTAWYACFVPATATSKPIVVVVHVERGGFGDVAAAPVARQILSQWFFGKPGVFKSGSSQTL